MKRGPLYPSSSSPEPSGPSVWFILWSVFCALVALLCAAGVVWLIVELLPHVTGLLDRVGR